MQTATKIRLLSHLRRIFPAWTLRHQAEAVEDAFDSAYREAKGWEERQGVLQHRDLEAREYWNAIAAIRSQKLVRRAQKLYIDTSALQWESDQYANHWLGDDVQSKLNRLVVDEERKTWEFRLKVVATVVGALTGLAGSLIGLVAISKKK